MTHSKYKCRVKIPPYRSWDGEPVPVEARHRLHPRSVEAIRNVDKTFIASMTGVALLISVGVNMSREWHRKHLGDDVPEQAPGEETLLGAAGDEVPPGGVVAGSFDQEFPGADPYAGIPADEVGLPPLSEAEQEAVAREADRLADDPDARRNL